MNVLYFVALIFWACRTNGGAAMGLETLRPAVLLPLRVEFPNDPPVVEWWREGQLLARFQRGRCDHGCGETHQLFPNGSLWLKHGGKKEEGRYSVKVYNEDGSLKRQVSITLRVIEIPSKQALEPGNTSVLLPLDSELELVQVNWKKDEQPLGELFRGICVNGCNEKHDLFLNGSFLLRRVQIGDKGRYSAEMFDKKGRLIHQTEILLLISGKEDQTEASGTSKTSKTVSKSGLPIPAIILIMEGTILLLVLVAFSAYLRKFVCRTQKLDHEFNIHLPLSIATTEVPGEDAGTETEGLDGRQIARIYETVEELTTFIPTGRTEVQY